MNAIEIGTKLGKSIALDTVADDMPREWCDLSGDDGSFLSDEGLEPHTEDWAAAEKAAKKEYVRLIDLFASLEKESVSLESAKRKYWDLTK